MEIIATIWKNPLDFKKIQEMLDAGATMLRIKWAHVTTEEVLSVVREVRQYLDEHKSDTKILLDMPEVKVRLGGLKQVKEQVVSDKQYVVKTADDTETINEYIPFSFSDFHKYFHVGDSVLVGDGELTFIVKQIVSDTEMVVEFVQQGELCQRRGLFSSRLADMFDHTESIIAAIPHLEEVRPDCLALSFVNGTAYMEKIKAAIRDHSGDTWKPILLAKIESQQGLNNAEEIIDASDMVVVARGDLALTTDYTRLILEQKRLCALGKKKGKPIIVATQILDSCLTNSIPTRPDIADVTNMALDGAAGVWFSKATAHNEHPGDVIRMVQRMFHAALTDPNHI